MLGEVLDSYLIQFVEKKQKWNLKM
jgi:hypothetical protein